MLIQEEIKFEELEAVLPLCVTVLLKVAAPLSDISRVRAVTSEPPSLPTNIISASEINDSILNLSLSSLNCAYIDEPSNNLTSPLSSALKSILPAESTVISPELKAIVVPSILKLSISIPASAVILPLKVAAPASEISRCKAVIVEPPSEPLNLQSSSVVLSKKSTPCDSCLISNTAFPSS